MRTTRHATAVKEEKRSSPVPRSASRTQHCASRTRAQDFSSFRCDLVGWMSTGTGTGTGCVPSRARVTCGSLAATGRFCSSLEPPVPQRRCAAVGAMATGEDYAQSAAVGGKRRDPSGCTLATPSPASRRSRLVRSRDLRNGDSRCWWPARTRSSRSTDRHSTVGEYAA